MEWKLAEGDSGHKKTKIRAEEKGALMLLLLLCGKTISAHAQSVGVAESYRGHQCSLPLMIFRGHLSACLAYRSSLGTG